MLNSNTQIQWNGIHSCNSTNIIGNNSNVDSDIRVTVETVVTAKSAKSLKRDTKFT